MCDVHMDEEQKSVVGSGIDMKSRQVKVLEEVRRICHPPNGGVQIINIKCVNSDLNSRPCVGGSIYNL